MSRVLALASAAMLVLAACGGATPAASAAPAAPTTAPTVAASPAPAAPAEVVAQGFKFAPLSLEVKVGTKVSWTNKDSSLHTVTSGAPGAKDGKFDGEIAASTGSFSFTFAQAGTFAYFCSRHPAMIATVVVK